MTDGRPDETTHCAIFRPVNYEQNVTSPTVEEDESGYLEYSGHVNKENDFHGKGKYWYDDGGIFIGEFLTVIQLMVRLTIFKQIQHTKLLEPSKENKKISEKKQLRFA